MTRDLLISAASDAWYAALDRRNSRPHEAVVDEILTRLESEAEKPDSPMVKAFDSSMATAAKRLVGEGVTTFDMDSDEIRLPVIASALVAAIQAIRREA